MRRSPLHDHLKAAGAVFGEVAGWERVNWFAPPGQERKYRYSWGRQNWFDNQRNEHMAVRTGVGLFDMTSFGKIRVEGRDACRFLNRVCSAADGCGRGAGGLYHVPEPARRDRGRPDGDAAVGAGLYAGGAGGDGAAQLAWLRDHVGEDFATITDVTAAEAVLCVMGPKSARSDACGQPGRFLERGSPSLWHAREIEIGMGVARAQRVTYVGELGWEIYPSADQAAQCN